MLMDQIEISKALQYGSSHGGLEAMFSEGSREIWEKIADDLRYASKRNQVEKAADQYRREPICVIPFSLYKLFDTTGSRKDYESAYFSRRGRLATFAALALLNGRKADLETLEDVIWAICDEYTWCLPAHLGGKSLQIPHVTQVPAEDGRVATADREHNRVVDLFSSETGFALSEILHLLKKQLSPIVVRRARREIIERILKPYCAIDSAFWWETGTNNWSAVCAGSVGTAALYLIDDDRTLAPILYRLIGTLEGFLSGYGNDGACTEGLGYWEYGFGFYTYFAELLRQRTAGKLDLLKNEKIRKIALFPQKCRLTDGNVVSFSDGNLSFRPHAGLFCFLKSRFPEVELPDRKYTAGLYDDNCYRWNQFSRDFVWDTGEQGKPAKDSACYLENAQWMIIRKSSGNLHTAFAAKGGNNGESHNHNDLGSFLLDVNGDVLLTDLGSGEYTRQYFGPERFTIFCNGSQGHSVPIIEKNYQSAGSEFYADVLNASEDKGLFRLDLTKAYSDSNLKRFIRSFLFESGKAVTLTVSDKFLFQKAPDSITERFISLYKPESAGQGMVRLEGQQGYILIHFNPSVMTCKFLTAEYKDHRSKTVTVQVIDFILKPGIVNTEAVFSIEAHSVKEEK